MGLHLFSAITTGVGRVEPPAITPGCRRGIMYALWRHPSWTAPYSFFIVFFFLCFPVSSGFSSQRTGVAPLPRQICVGMTAPSSQPSHRPISTWMCSLPLPHPNNDVGSSAMRAWIDIEKPVQQIDSKTISLVTKLTRIMKVATQQPVPLPYYC